MAIDSESSELSRITFVFETICTADCKFNFLAVREDVTTYMLQDVGYKEVKLYISMSIYEVNVFLCRDIISGIMMWWSSGKAATVNSCTPT